LTRSDRMPGEQAEAELRKKLETLIEAPASDVESLKDAARHPALNEDLALRLLRRRDLPAAVLEDLSRNARVMKVRKVRIALIAHQRTPRHVALPQVRHLFTFDLLHIALLPQVAADVKLVVEETLITRLHTLAAGERLTLARRGSGRVVAELLNDEEPRIIAVALENPRLTEADVIRALTRTEPSRKLIHDVCDHAKWSVQRDVRAALLRSHYTPLASAIAFTESFTPRALEDILSQSDLAENTRDYLLKLAAKRAERVKR
jgi:hypothetical protein